MRLLSEVLRSSLVVGDSALAVAVVRVVRLLLQLSPLLAVGVGSGNPLSQPRSWADEALERSLLSNLTRLALGHASTQASGDSLRCLEAFLGSSSGAAAAATSSALEFSLGCAFALAQEGMPVPPDNFLAACDAFCRHVLRAVPALKEGAKAGAAAGDGRFDPNLQISPGAAVCQSLALALSALASRVQPFSRGRASGFGNGLSVTSILPVLLGAYQTFKAPRRSLLSLLSALARMHPLHPALLHEAGATRLARDHTDHSCLLAKKGLALDAAEGLVLAGCLDLLAALLCGRVDPVSRAASRYMYPPAAAGRAHAQANAEASPAISVAQLRLLAALSPRHASSPSYAALVHYAARLLEAAGEVAEGGLAAGAGAGGRGSLTVGSNGDLSGATQTPISGPASSASLATSHGPLSRWLGSAARAAREEIMFGTRVEENCRMLAVAGPALRAAHPGEGEHKAEREVLAAVSKLVTEAASSAGAGAVGPGPESLHVLLASRGLPGGAFATLYGRRWDLDALAFAACFPSSLAAALFPAAAHFTGHSTPPAPDLSGPASLASGSAAFYQGLLVTARAIMHPVRLFAWPGMPTPVLHANLLVLLALSRGPASRSGHSPSPGSGAIEAFCHTGLLALETHGDEAEAPGGYEPVSLGEIAVMLLSLLTGTQAVVAAPSNPCSTVGTYLLVPHAHTQHMSKSLPAMRTTALLLLADLFSLPRLPLPMPDPLPAVRTVCARLEAMRHALPAEGAATELVASLQFLAAAARAARLLGTLTGLSSLSPAVSAQTPACIARPPVLEAINDAIGRSGAGKARLVGLFWALLRGPGVLEAASSSAHNDDAVAALLLRWVLWGLRIGCLGGAGGAASSAGLALSLDTCILLQQVACPLRCFGLCPPAVAQGLFRYVLSRPETEEAALRLARMLAQALVEAVAGGDSAVVTSAGAALCCALDTLHSLCELYNPQPHIGYDCPGLFFPAKCNIASDAAPPGACAGPFAHRLMAPQGLPLLLERCLLACAPSLPASLQVHSSALRLAAVAVEAEHALNRLRAKGEGGEAPPPCVLEWARVRAFPLLRGYLDQVLCSQSLLLFFGSARDDNEAAAPEAVEAGAAVGVGGWAAASAWEKLGVRPAFFLSKAQNLYSPVF